MVLLRPARGSAGVLSCPVPGSVGVWRFVAGLFCYYPGSGFAGGTAGRPAPAAAVSGASGLGAAPQVLAIYTPECRKGQVEPKPLKTQKDSGQAVLFPQYCVFWKKTSLGAPQQLYFLLGAQSIHVQRKLGFPSQSDLFYE